MESRAGGLRVEAMSQSDAATCNPLIRKWKGLDALRIRMHKKKEAVEPTEMVDNAAVHNSTGSVRAHHTHGSYRQAFLIDFLDNIWVQSAW
jgi:hypothetical protein